MIRLNRRGRRDLFVQKSDRASVLREWASFLLALVGAVVGTIGFVTSRTTATLSQRVQVDQMLDEAWDRMIGPNAGRYVSEFVEDPHELELARRLIGRAKLLAPAYAKVYWTEATLAHAERRFSDAIMLNKKAISLDPTASIPHNKIGFVHVQTKQWHKAEHEFREAIKLDPQDASPRSNLCYVLFRQNRLSEAEGACAEALRLYPTYVTARQNMLAVQVAKAKGATGRDQPSRGNS